MLWNFTATLTLADETLKMFPKLKSVVVVLKIIIIVWFCFICFKILTIAVLVILITSPIGAIGIVVAGPRMLHQTSQEEFNTCLHDFSWY